VIALTAPLTCQECGGDVMLLASGAADWSSASCMVQCSECRAEFIIRVRMDLKTLHHQRPEHWKLARKRAAQEAVAS
jgi:predicted transposase YbfD/YdcC